MTNENRKKHDLSATEYAEYAKPIKVVNAWFRSAFCNALLCYPSLLPEKRKEKRITCFGYPLLKFWLVALYISDKTAIDCVTSVQSQSVVTQ